MTKTKAPARLQLSHESDDVHAAMHDLNPLPCVLLAASYVDRCLVDLLRAHFIDKSGTATDVLDPNKGTLTELSSRAKIAYCIGLISKGLFKNILKISEIRNLFAHSHKAKSFDDDDVIDKCNQLFLPDEDFFTITGNTLVDAYVRDIVCTSHRAKFSYVAVVTANALQLTAVKHQSSPTDTFTISADGLRPPT